MAESQVSILSPCETYGILLDRHCVVLSRYQKAISDLVFLVGKQEGVRFAEAKRTCQRCLTSCRGTAAALRAHRSAHRC